MGADRPERGRWNRAVRRRLVRAGSADAQRDGRGDEPGDRKDERRALPDHDALAWRGEKRNPGVEPIVGWTRASPAHAWSVNMGPSCPWGFAGDHRATVGLGCEPGALDGARRAERRRMAGWISPQGRRNGSGARS